MARPLANIAMDLKYLFRQSRKILVAAVMLGLIVAASVWYVQLPSSDAQVAKAQTSSNDQPFVSVQPDREVTADHQLKRVRHKNADGLSPVELVGTPQGIVTIQRTYTSAGKLLKEEASLDGKPVAVPHR